MWDPTGVNSFHGNGSIDLNGPSADSNLANNATPHRRRVQRQRRRDARVLRLLLHEGLSPGRRQRQPQHGRFRVADQVRRLRRRQLQRLSRLPAADMRPISRPARIIRTRWSTRPSAATPAAATPTTPSITSRRRCAATHGWTPCLQCHPSATHAQNRLAVCARTSRSRSPRPTTTRRRRWRRGPPAAGPTASFCTNVSCHGGVQTPFWSGGTITIATQCTLCHIYENVANRAAATQWNSAITGVHAVTTTVSGQNHSVNAAGDLRRGDLLPPRGADEPPRRQPRRFGDGRADHRDRQHARRDHDYDRPGPRPEHSTPARSPATRKGRPGRGSTTGPRRRRDHRHRQRLRDLPRHLRGRLGWGRRRHRPPEHGARRRPGRADLGARLRTGTATRISTKSPRTTAPARAATG